MSGAALAQPFSAGIKGGLPLNDFLNEVQGTSTTNTGHYLVGPEVEVRLPLGLSIEFDALYRHFSYTNVLGGPTMNTVTSVGSSSNWEFPLVLKYKFPSKIVRPYLEAGVAWDTLAGLKNTVNNVACSAGACSNVLVAPPTASSAGTMGVVIGGGVDIHAIVIHVSPELRFTRWADNYFNLSGVLNSSKNQAEVLVGFTF